jgi:hypothetical protein
MIAKIATARKPALGTALAASIASEARSVEDRFAKADKLFGGGEADTSAPQSEPMGQGTINPKHPVHAQPDVAEEATVSAPVARVVRDSFSFPPHDHQRIDALLSDVLRQGIRSNKSEIVRAGLIAFEQLPAEQRNQIVQSLAKPKPGRPV